MRSEVSFWACLGDRDNLVDFMSFTEPPLLPLSCSSLLLCVILRRDSESYLDKDDSRANMPYEVTISGGAPWGFRLSGGAPSDEGIRVRLVHLELRAITKHRTAASLQVARRQPPMFTPAITCWPSTCKTWRRLHF